jgi:hypothetical protein
VQRQVRAALDLLHVLDGGAELRSELLLREPGFAPQLAYTTADVSNESIGIVAPHGLGPWQATTMQKHKVMTCISNNRAGSSWTCASAGGEASMRCFAALLCLVAACSTSSPDPGGGAPDSGGTPDARQIEDASSDAAVDGGSTYVDLTPKTGDARGGFAPYNSIGYEVTFAAATQVNGIELEWTSAPPGWTATAHVWSTALGTPPLPGGTGTAVIATARAGWYRSNVSYTFQPGVSYVIGFTLSDGIESQFDNVNLPFTVGGVTVTSGCIGPRNDAGATAKPLCGSAVGFKIRLSVQK